MTFLYTGSVGTLLSVVAAAQLVEPSTPLGQKLIAKFYYPMAFSWLFMGMEMPICSAIISRRPDSTVQLAGLLLMMQLAMWIESPVIDLLSTSTTLARSRQSYIQITKFTWIIMGWVTLFHIAVACTPLYNFITLDIMKFDPAAAAATRVGFIAMIPWSASIGWRRFRQGLLIRHARTKSLAHGTTVRVSTLTTVAMLLFLFTKLPGVTLAGIALGIAVFAEATFIHFASQDLAEAFLNEGSSDILDQSEGTFQGYPRVGDTAAVDDHHLTLKALFKFHIPLSLTTIVTLTQGPILAAGINRTGASALVAVAAWQVSNTWVWLIRSPAYALPEVIITLWKDEKSKMELRKFCVRIALFTSGLLLVLGLSRLDRFLFTDAVEGAPDVAAAAHVALMGCLLLPAIGAIQCYYRGLLTSMRLTSSRLLAIGVSFSALTVGVAWCVLLHVQAIYIGAIASTIAMGLELATLAGAWRVALHKKRLLALQTEG